MGSTGGTIGSKKKSHVISYLHKITGDTVCKKYG
jgi:hypothetical protein